MFLSRTDIETLRKVLGVEREEFLRCYCREVALGVARRISLKEKINLDCVFWETDGCTVYEARPLQCRSFPFWSSSLSSRDQWEDFSTHCPGIGRGRVHRRREIERWLAMRLAEGFLEG